MRFLLRCDRASVLPLILYRPSEITLRQRLGAMDRVPEDRELQNGIMAYGVTNILGALLGGLPTATYSQNVGIVTTTKVINRWVLGLAAAILGVAGIVPKFSALLTTIPQCVLGGATVSVFASIAMTGMKLVASAEMDYRNSSIVGLAAAIGVGVSRHLLHLPVSRTG